MVRGRQARRSNFTLTVDPLVGDHAGDGHVHRARWIAIFSVGYMHGDPGYPRFFAVMSLFVFSMCVLVLANNFLLLVRVLGRRRPVQLPAGRLLVREAVGRGGGPQGVPGHPHRRRRAAPRHLPAVEDRRLAHRPDRALRPHREAPAATTATLTTACLLLFCGAVGKSAQFPLHVWLPDAMEGPTPVSRPDPRGDDGDGRRLPASPAARRCSRCAPTAQLVGRRASAAITALLAALIALTQTDLKRVLAYSTVSQLGYMFLALGSGRGDQRRRSPSTAAMFHLFTHAFFKALLFLAAGSVMHAMGDVIDMRQFGGLRQADADDALDVPVRRRGAGRASRCCRLLEQGRDPRRRCSRRARHGGRTPASYFVLLAGRRC